MTYYLMIERENASAPWVPELGSTDKSDVEFEIEHRRDHGAKRKNLAILTFGRVPSQKVINQRVAERNGAVALAAPLATRTIEVWR